ncbi:OPT superfamily oligopeptide transporter [Atractiella rhizophila]|nr:OPT superfamily oligopeptide transporter [Atractiella rhizophila]
MSAQAARDAEDVQANIGNLPVLPGGNLNDFIDEKRSFDDEKKDAEIAGSVKIHGDDVNDAKGSDDDPDYASLPQIVRELVDFDDDETAPVLTWRFFLLSTIFTALGAWLQQMGFFRTTYVPYSIYFVQIASLYLGRLLAASLPVKTIGFGRLSFELNPGPFSVKEHVAVVLAANTGGTNNLGDYVLAPLDIFYGKPMNGWIAIIFMISAVFIGFSLASLARVFLIGKLTVQTENPVTLFPLTLQQVSVFKAMRLSAESGSNTAKKQMRVFWWSILAVFLYQTLPEYAAPFLSSLAFLCWVTKNPTAQFLSSGLGGAGILNITLDWSNIGSTFIYYPYWALVNIFVASVIGAWILYPVGKLTGAWQSDLYPINSQALRLANGSSYPTARLLNADYTLNEELFEQFGPPRMSANLRWAYFFSYVAYIGAFLSCALFEGPAIVRSLRAAWRGDAVYNSLAQAHTSHSYIYAISGYQVPVGYFNELFYGYLIDLGGSRHPVGSLSYRVISGQCWYELSDMKLGYYFHIPPRATLLAQIWGICVGVPVNYATILWVCNTKRGYLEGSIADPNRQWTGQTVISLNNQGIAFGLVGPKKLFSDPMYTPLPYGFVLGAGASILLYVGHRLTKGRVPFQKVNIAIFGTTMENFYGNISTGFLMTFVLGSLNHLYVKKYKYEWWKKYAYLTGAAFDTGFNLNMLFLFVAFSAFKVITMILSRGASTAPKLSSTFSLTRCYEWASLAKLAPVTSLFRFPVFLTGSAFPSGTDDAVAVGSGSSCALFEGPAIVRSLRAAWRGDAVYNNILTKMIRKYPQVPIWWNIALFAGSFFALLGLVLKKDILYMPIYSYFVGLVFGILIVIPMGYIYAISGYQVPVGYFNELFYGYLIDLGGSRHPVGSLSYRVISGQCWYELSDMKLGYYFHIPPRATLLAQIWGICVGVPVNYATILWVCNTKRGYLEGSIADPNRQWTGQTVISLNNQGIAFGLVGPKKLFSDPMYTPLPYGFVLGAGASILLYVGHRLTKGRVPFQKVNIAIFGTTMENFYGNISTGFLMTFVLGSLNHLYVKKYKYEWWKKYAYLTGAAFDTGFNLNMLFLFVAFSAFKVITMPNYFFNNADSVERCFHSA